MGAAIRTSRDRLTRTEPFEVFTRPQRSWPARVLGLAVRLRAEITAAVVALAAWRWLTQLVETWAAVLIVVSLVLAVTAWPVSRRFVVCRCWAVATRHRFRAACIERRIMNFSGNVPLLLWARPTPVGERVWVVLRAGIDAADVERNLFHIASACWAADARATAHRRVCALVLVDVVRRDPLRGPARTSPHADRPARRRRLVLIGGGRSA